MPLVIRSARLDDAPTLALLMRVMDWNQRLSEAPLDSITDTFRAHLALCLADNSHSIYIAEIDEIVVGYGAVHWVPFLMLSGPEGYVSELFVSDTARGQGIGAQILKTIEQEARTRGCSRLGLLNSRARESYTRKFYEKQGWVERNAMISFVLPLD